MTSLETSNGISNTTGILSRQGVNSLGFLACALMVAYAYYLQFYADLIPCPLCLCQRLALILLGGIFLAAAVHNPRASRARYYGALIALVAAMSTAIAGYHVWLQHLSSEEAAFCLPPLDYLLESFRLFEVVQLVLDSPGDCRNIDWTLLGLSIPFWTLLSFVGLGVVGTACNLAQYDEDQ